MKFEKNKKVGRLTMLEKTEKRRIRCLCECGNMTEVYDANIGKTTNSCGCLAKELISTHGMSNTRQYEIWLDMKGRCLKYKKLGYENYGGRGITFSEKWSSFEGFWEDMRDGYSDNLTLDRIDPNGNYCKENCRWVSKATQSRNKRGYKSNKLNIPNIFISTKRGKEYISCKVTMDGKAYKKSIRLNGNITLEDAITLLKEWRDSKRISLGFSCFHGSTRET
jgi:hypothetical protein